MYCMKCGKEIKDGALFCNWCGCKTNLAEQEQKSVSDIAEAGWLPGSWASPDTA